MKLLLENWRRYVNEAGDPDSDADNNPEPKAIAKSLERATIEKTIEDFSFNSAQSSQHRWGRGQPIIDYRFDESSGVWIYTATIPGDPNDPNSWEDINLEKGEDLETFLTRVKIYLNEAGELGSQVFADRAPEGPHQGVERDTKVEAALYKALQAHLKGPTSHLFDEEKMDLVLRLVKDPQYNDVFTLYTSSDVYRGMGVSDEWLDARIPGWQKLPEISAPGSTWTEVQPADFEFVPQDTAVSSWSNRLWRAKDFARHFARRNKGVYGVVMIADSKTNNFLDLSELYKFRGLDKYAWEKEVVGLGSIRVKEIQIWKYDPEGAMAGYGNE